MIRSSEYWDLCVQGKHKEAISLYRQASPGQRRAIDDHWSRQTRYAIYEPHEELTCKPDSYHYEMAGVPRPLLQFSAESVQRYHQLCVAQRFRDAGDLWRSMTVDDRLAAIRYCHEVGGITNSKWCPHKSGLYLVENLRG